MADLGILLAQYGYLIVVAFILFEQLGLPLPASPVMLALGAVAGAGHLSLSLLLILGVVACVTADSIWFFLGRRYGNRIIRLLCRLTLEPDDCSRRSGDLYHRYGEVALVVAKFIPGLNTVAAPLAGILRLQPHRFLLWDSVGATFWIGTMLGLGYLFTDQVEALGMWLSHFGAGMAIILGLFLAGYLALKLWIRQRFVAKLRTVRIDPQSLWKRIRAGEAITIVDLRYAREADLVGAKVPGAIQILPAELSLRSQEIPPDQEVILYCSCPNEATSARTAMRLKSRGVREIRPLLGGFEGWVKAGLPVESLHSVKLGKPLPVLYSNAPPPQAKTAKVPR